MNAHLFIHFCDSMVAPSSLAWNSFLPLGGPMESKKFCTKYISLSKIY